MNRPEARNALSGQMMAIMREAWDQVDDDPDIRVCVLTGAGGAFCAGADLKAMTSSAPRRPVHRRRLGPEPDRAAAEGPPADQAADRGGGGAGDRRRHRDPAGDRHPGGRRERAVRRLGGALGAVPAGRVGGAAAPPDPLHASPPTSCSPAGTSPPPRRCDDRPDRPRRPRRRRRWPRRWRSPRLIAANGPLAVQAILRTIRETEGMPENEAFKLEAELGMEVFAQRGREGGPAGLRRAAEAAKPAEVSPGAGG